MGQQQLLLIVLGVIIVGVAIVVGINLFNANAEQGAKDTIIAEGTNIGALAQQYFKKPTAMGGGNNDFSGFTTAKVPSTLLSSPSATWTFGTGNTTGITIYGTPKGGYSGWTVQTVVTATAINSNVVAGT